MLPRPAYRPVHPYDLELTQAVDRNMQSNIRSQYLKLVGLKWDPFINPIAEQEFTTFSQSDQDEAVSTKKHHFSLALFVPPKNPINPNRPLIADLRQSATGFIFGAPGMGKTSLRLTLESMIRLTPQGTLVVSYVLGQDIETPPTLDEHWQRLSRQLAIDLFIQICEQFKPGIDMPSPEQVASLGTLIRMGKRPLQRIANYILSTNDKASDKLGIAERWRQAGRLPVRYVARSPQLKELIQQAMAQPKTPIANDGWANLQTCLAIARQWQYQHILVLVDGVDNWSGDPVKMMALVKPLLKETNILSQENIHINYFLPKSLHPFITAFLDNHSHLFTQHRVISLDWDEPALRSLLINRLSVAGSRRVSFNDFADPNLELDLDQWLYQQANRSPRNLLQLASNLIDEHLKTVRCQQIPLDSPIQWHTIQSIDKF